MTISVRFEPEIEKRLDALCRSTGRARSYYIRKAVEEKLEEMEDLYISLQRLENSEQKWTLEELETQQDLDRVEH